MAIEGEYEYLDGVLLIPPPLADPVGTSSHVLPFHLLT
jgi:hypothetical protein